MKHESIESSLHLSSNFNQPIWIKRSRGILNLPPAVFVIGLILFWLIIILFGDMMNIPVLRGKRHMPESLELLGWLLLFGTAISFLAYPVLWLLLYIFKKHLAARARYFTAVWVLSGVTLAVLWPYIHWFMD